MDHRTQGFLLILLMIILSVVFQVQMKQFANALGSLPRVDGWRDQMAALIGAAMSWRGLAIIVLAGCLFLLWLAALTRLDLSFALPLASIALLVTAVGGGLWLGEGLSWIRVTGLVLTAIGIGMVINS